MRSPHSAFLFGFAALFFAWCRSPSAMGQGSGSQDARENGESSKGIIAKVPSGVILVKGAWSSASDATTPLPEDGVVDHGVFHDPYFGLSYALPADWTQKYKGPPPSDTGRYVLANLSPAETFKGRIRGSILIGAEDLFFTPTPARNAGELIDYMKDHLEIDYTVETPPKQIKIADRSFAFFAYWSPAAELHWYVLATEIRCHVIQIVMTSRDIKLLDSLVLDLNKMKLSGEASPLRGTAGNGAPVCIKDYARKENMITQVDPVFTEHRFNPAPVRIVIGKDGKVTHIHFISAFPDQTKAINDAVTQWKFKPYEKDGHALEVETGVQFGRGNGANTFSSPVR